MRRVSEKVDVRTHVTPRQAAVHASFMRTHSESETARELGLSQIRVREALVQFERNLLRDGGVRPPSLKAMIRGDVTTRFHVSRDVMNGRPAKHERAVRLPLPAARTAEKDSDGLSRRVLDAPGSGVRRVIVVAVEAGRPTHRGFVRNLLAYADHLGAEVMVHVLGHGDCTAADLRPHIERRPVEIAGRLDVRSDIAPPRVARSPLDNLHSHSSGRWAAFPHPVFQLTSLPRLRSAPPRVQLTTGVVTVPEVRVAGIGSGGQREVGALVVEACRDGRVHVRHIAAAAASDGTLHDLDVRVADGRVTTHARVAGLVYGDIHHARLDPMVAEATWGRDGSGGLAARLRPHLQVVHDLVDFSARSHHERRNPHAAFWRHVSRTGSVRRELEAAAAFLGELREPSGRVCVIHSNHDDMLLRWLREADHRTDPENAEFFLDREAAMLARIRAGVGERAFFAETLRQLSTDALPHVRFLADGESLAIAGVECGLHGDRGPDGARGSVGSLERLGADLVVGHSHSPQARGGVYGAGVCQLDMGYNRGPTSWAVAHVLIHDNGSRQHVFLDGDAFAA